MNGRKLSDGLRQGLLAGTLLIASAGLAGGCVSLKAPESISVSGHAEDSGNMSSASDDCPELRRKLSAADSRIKSLEDRVDDLQDELKDARKDRDKYREKYESLRRERD